MTAAISTTIDNPEGQPYTKISEAYAYTETRICTYQVSLVFMNCNVVRIEEVSGLKHLGYGIAYDNSLERRDN